MAVIGVSFLRRDVLSTADPDRVLALIPAALEPRAEAA